LPFTSALSAADTDPATLSGLDGSCSLQNESIRVVSDSLYPSYVATPLTQNLAYAPSQPQFQQLNAFYYAAALRDLLLGLGANLSAMGRVSLDAHCSISNNAYFSPSAKKVCLGYVNLGGGRMVWAADDADVVVHESGHAINHALASTSIMNSSGEAGAVDEGVADYWALTLLNDAQLSEWFLGSIGASYVRDATQNHAYPASMEYEVHDDSRVIAQVLWDLRQPGNLGRATTDALVKRALQLLPSYTRFAEFYQAIYDASGPTFLNLSNAQRTLIVNKFTAKGIHRVDSANGFRLSTAGGGVSQVYVIDDHTISAQSGGNCNGVLDVGETALVLVNLENPNAAAMGMGLATLTGASAGIQIPSGGYYGEFFRFHANGDFVSSLPAGGSGREDAVIMASFLIKATTAGNKNLTLDFTPMYADATGGSAVNPDVSVSFSLNVGNAATSTSCDNAALWP
jgi:hypothetical protein